MDRKTQNLRENTVYGVEKMFSNEQIPSVLSYVKYEPNEVQGTTRHRMLTLFILLHYFFSKTLIKGAYMLRDSIHPV